MKYFQSLQRNEGFLIFHIRTKENPKLILENLRKRYPHLAIQFVKPSAVQGDGHLIWAIRQNWVAAKRRILAANRQEVDLLMRLTQTDQISEAIHFAGVSSRHRGAIVVVIGPKIDLENFESWICERQDTSSDLPLRNSLSRYRPVEKERWQLLLLEKSAILLATSRASPLHELYTGL